MKKFLSITLAAICALSVAALSFSGCAEKDSDVVTKEEWTEAMSVYKALNATVTGTVDFIYSTTSNGVTKTESTAGDITMKTALSIYDIYVMGNTYYDVSRTVTSTTDEEGTEIVTTDETQTGYEVFGEESYSYVSKETRTDTADDWDGERYDYPAEASSSYTYSQCIYIFKTLADMYDEFEYVDGAYSYISENDDTMYIKINNGCLTSVVTDVTFTYSFGETYSYTVTTKYNLKFSDYGKTSVSVPEEYTYSYYYLRTQF